MNANRQLWLATGLLMALLFFCAMALNTYWAKQNLLHDLTAQAHADAAIIAGNPGSMLPPQIPAERYAHIQITQFDGAVRAAATPQTSTGVPDWFTRVFDIQAPTAKADIVRESQTIGVVSTEPNIAPLVSSLWQLALQTAAVFGAGALIMAVLAGAILQRVLRSVKRIVEHAESLTGGSYTVSDYATCRELVPAQAALNNLGSGVEQVIKRRTAIAKPAPETQDPLTGLGNRATLREALKSELRRKDDGTPACVCIIHLNDIAALNREFGRAAVDTALREIAQGLEALCRQFNDWKPMRIRGADFAIFACHAAEPGSVADESRTVVEAILREHSMTDSVRLPIVATRVVRGEQTAATLQRLDGVLAAAIASQTSMTCIAGENDLNMRPVADQLVRWRQIFEKSFADLNFSLETFPVTDLQGELLHLESPTRLAHDGELLNAQDFLPWIQCLELSPALDQRVVELALAHIREHDKPLSIHLSAGALSEPKFLVWLGEQLSASEAIARRVCIEFTEDIALRHARALVMFCTRVHELGAQVGVEHAGHQLARLQRLQGTALDYLKIDGQFVEAIDRNKGNQTLVRALCTLSRELGMTPIAEGVTSESERITLAELGIGGITGPGVKPPGIAA